MLTASLVLFHNDPAMFGAAMQSFLNGCDGKLVVVDNSAKPLVHPLFAHPRVSYDFAGLNLGFGAAHNRAFAAVSDISEAHLFLNPDVTFDRPTLEHLFDVLLTHPDVVAVMPRVRYPDGAPQHLCKLLPRPDDLILRRFVPVNSWRERMNRRYELRDLPETGLVKVPNLSGCCLLVRSETLRTIAGFDERFFMYLEDVDLVRRLGDIGRTVYSPEVEVVHAYGKGSYRSLRLLKYHVRSAILYFNKWGWLVDPVRKSRNHEARHRPHVQA